MAQTEQQPLLPVLQGGRKESDTGPKSHFKSFLPSWVSNYRASHLQADLVGAITVASLYIPLCFSFASIAHVPPSASLYAFVFHPTIYALMGSSHLMIVGPEATGSLLVGAVVKRRVDKDDGAREEAAISGIATSLAGMMLCGAGMARLGFVDNILSRPLMKGFIGGVGLTLVIEQIIPGLGLHLLEQEVDVDDGPPVVKLYFLAANLLQSRVLSSVFFISGLACVLGSTYLKKRFSNLYPGLILFPERFIVILVSALLARWLDLDNKGLQVVGAIDVSEGGLPGPRWPLQSWGKVRSVAGTSLFIALMGYFESSVTAKSIRPANSKATCKPNRELAALGVANVVGGCFGTLPAFGGFGRSKLNAQAGGMTPMASIFLGMISLLCALSISQWLLYYVPKPTLSAMSCAVGISMLQECQHDVAFFWSSSAWGELALMSSVACAMFLNSMELGVEIGSGLTLLVLIHSATYSRAEVEPTSQPWSNECSDHQAFAEEYASMRLGQVLSFTNIGHAIEQARHCLAATRSRGCFLLDCQNVQKVDVCSAQILRELFASLVKEEIKVVVVLPSMSFPRCRARMANLLDIDRSVHIAGCRVQAEALAKSIASLG